MKRTKCLYPECYSGIRTKKWIYFLYNDNLVKLTKKVSVDVTDAPIENVLDQIFNNSEVRTYKIIDNQIVVSAIKAEIPKTSSLQQQKCAYHRTSKRYHRRTYHWCFWWEKGQQVRYNY
ncbi:STN domain-containing protein [Bacteroides fragilis]|nr:STN domain-containing protein [Bacteroides fragilis]